MSAYTILVIKTDVNYTTALSEAIDMVAVLNEAGYKEVTVLNTIPAPKETTDIPIDENLNS